MYRSHEEDLHAMNGNRDHDDDDDDDDGDNCTAADGDHHDDLISCVDEKEGI